MLTSFHVNGEGGIAEQQTDSVNGEGEVVLGIFSPCLKHYYLVSKEWAGGGGWGLCC